MNIPKISVIVPVYNVEKYLTECLNSIINQTLKEIEIICVNDGSTDNSLEILKEYASIDERIKIIDKENDGQGYARKIGLDLAIGEYILFCDSDDKYESNNAFEILIDEVTKLNVDILLFGINFWYKNKIESFKVTYGQKQKVFSSKELINYIYETNVEIYCKLYSNAFLKRYNDWFFPKKVYMYQDAPFHRQILLRADKIGVCEECFYRQRKFNNNSVVRSKFSIKKIEGYSKSLHAEYDIIKKANKLDELKKQFVYYILNTAYNFVIREYAHPLLIQNLKIILKEFKSLIDSVIKDNPISNKLLEFPFINKDRIFFYKAIIRFDYDSFVLYFNKKYIKNKNRGIQIKDEIIKNRDFSIEQKNNEIKDLCTQNNIQDQEIKQLQNSWSYRIGRLITYPLSIPLEFYKYIHDYNLVKKSGLFDSKYYLANNEDVKKAKINPIKHYLKFGWKEGRNPSEKFNGNDYLNKRPDVRVAGICPLVHYLKFGKNEYD